MGRQRPSATPDGDGAAGGSGNDRVPRHLGGVVSSGPRRVTGGRDGSAPLRGLFDGRITGQRWLGAVVEESGAAAVKKTSVVVAAVISVAIAALTSVGVVASSEDRDNVPSSPVAITSSPVPEKLTPQVAARAFRTYVVNDDVARAGSDERLALSWAAHGQAQLIAAEFRKAAFTGDPVPRYAYGRPALFVPRLTSYPHWFVVAADRTDRNAAGESRRTALMAFIRGGPGVRWRLSLSTVLAPKAKLPKVALDKEGYADPLPTFDEDLVIQPRGVPAIQATIAEEGPDTVAAKAMKPGPVTTGYYERGRREKREAKRIGVAADSVFVATAFPIFPLRTVNGDGLVLYALSRDTVHFLKDKEKGRLPIPSEAAHLLDSMIMGQELHLTETLQFAALDPTKAKNRRPPPRAEVLAHDGDVTHTSQPEPKVP